ncbi:MAG: hypothetical protein ABSA80_10175 [Terriglobales bacterium]|jgi:hypothetical protein
MISNDGWEPGMIPSAEQAEFLLRAELCACRIRSWLNAHAKAFTFCKLRRRDVFRGVNGQRYPHGVFDEALMRLERNGFIAVEGTRIRVVVEDKLGDVPLARMRTTYAQRTPR